MNIEKQPNQEVADEDLAHSIIGLYREATQRLKESGDESFFNALHEFDAELKERVREGYSTEAWLGVPEWHLLVGSTPEYRDIDPAARQYIVEAVCAFVSQWKHQFQEGKDS